MAYFFYLAALQLFNAVAILIVWFWQQQRIKTLQLQLSLQLSFMEPKRVKNTISINQEMYKNEIYDKFMSMIPDLSQTVSDTAIEHFRKEMADIIKPYEEIMNYVFNLSLQIDEKDREKFIKEVFPESATILLEELETYKFENAAKI